VEGGEVTFGAGGVKISDFYFCEICADHVDHFTGGGDGVGEKFAVLNGEAFAFGDHHNAFDGGDVECVF